MTPALRVVAVVLLVALLVPALAAACPLCKEASSDADKPGSTSMWRGMYWSILFMMAAPFAMVGTVVVLVLRARRRRLSSAPQPSRALAPGSRGARF